MTPPNFIDRTGQIYGRLTVLRQIASTRKWHTRWLCRCVCGEEVEVNGNDFAKKRTQSCGCLRRERTAEANTRHGATKGGKHTPEFNAWVMMKSRCFYPGNNRFKFYGARGVTVCEEWRNSFEAFLAHVGLKPSPKHTLGRINNDGNYEPGNVRWETYSEQNRNRRPFHRKS